MTYTHKMVNGIRVNLTSDEISELESRDAEWEAQQAQPKVKVLTVEGLAEVLKAKGILAAEDIEIGKK